VRPKIERAVHVKVKAHAHENNMDVSDAYRSLIESMLEVANQANFSKTSLGLNSSLDLTDASSTYSCTAYLSASSLMGT
jgi:hypothetical protein